MSTVEPLIIKTWKAAVQLRRANDKQLQKMLLQLADALEQHTHTLLKANQKDLEKQDPANPRTDRLLLNEQRIKGIANSRRKSFCSISFTSKIGMVFITDKSLV